MQSLLFIVGGVLLATVVQSLTLPKACPPQGNWSQWKPTVACNQTCGMCGHEEATRICESTARGCPCEGSTVYSGPCGADICLFPKPTCCKGYKKMFDSKNKKFFCAEEAKSSMMG